MPDWNPAEIIGTNPKNLPLAYIKIKLPIMLKQKKIMGYKDVGKTPLMYFLGINLTLMLEKFQFFLPDGLDKQVKKIDYYWLNKLKNNPHHHDKMR